MSNSYEQRSFELEVLAILKLKEFSFCESTILIEIPGWSSLRFLEIIVALEKKLNCLFDAEDLVKLKTWGDFIKLIKSKLNG